MWRTRCCTDRVRLQGGHAAEVAGEEGERDDSVGPQEGALQEGLPGLGPLVGRR